MQDPFPPRCRAQFKALRCLAQGTFAEVWLADQLSLGRQAVIKLLTQYGASPEERLRFHRGARITSRLAHPHVITVLDHDGEDEVPWIAYEYLTGGTLREQIDGRQIGPVDALRLGLQLASALQVAHDHEVLHRDLKPENVLMLSRDHIKLTDFGLARQLTGGTFRTADGVLVGTRNYMAPELFEGTPASALTDIFALGVTLYELLVGRPLTAEEEASLAAHGKGGRALPLEVLNANIPAPAGAVVMGMMTPSPAGRYQGAAAASEALRRALSALQNVPSQLPPIKATERLDLDRMSEIAKVVERVQKPRQRPRTSLWALELLLLLLIALQLIREWRQRHPQVVTGPAVIMRVMPAAVPSHRAVGSDEAVAAKGCSLADFHRCYHPMVAAMAAGESLRNTAHFRLAASSGLDFGADANLWLTWCRLTEWLEGPDVSPVLARTRTVDEKLAVDLLITQQLRGVPDEFSPQALRRVIRAIAAGPDGGQYWLALGRLFEHSGCEESARRILAVGLERLSGKEPPEMTPLIRAGLASARRRAAARGR